MYTNIKYFMNKINISHKCSKHFGMKISKIHANILGPNEWPGPFFLKMVFQLGRICAIRRLSQIATVLQYCIYCESTDSWDTVRRTEYCQFRFLLYPFVRPKKCTWFSIGDFYSKLWRTIFATCRVFGQLAIFFFFSFLRVRSECTVRWDPKV